MKTSPNEKLGKNNEKLKIEIEFQTEEEKGTIGNETTINKNKNKKEIEMLKEDIKLKAKKINMLNEKKRL